MAGWSPHPVGSQPVRGPTPIDLTRSQSSVGTPAVRPPGPAAWRGVPNPEALAAEHELFGSLPSQIFATQASEFPAGQPTPATGGAPSVSSESRLSMVTVTDNLVREATTAGNEWMKLVTDTMSTGLLPSNPAWRVYRYLTPTTMAKCERLANFGELQSICEAAYFAPGAWPNLDAWVSETVQVRLETRQRLQNERNLVSSSGHAPQQALTGDA